MFHGGCKLFQDYQEDAENLNASIFIYLFIMNFVQSIQI